MSACKRWLVALFALWVCVPARADEAVETPEPSVARWIVVVDDVRPARRRGWAGGSDYRGRFAYDDDLQLARLARRIARDYAVDVSDQWPIRTLRVHCLVVTIRGDEQATLDRLLADNDVRWVQPMNDFDGMTSTAPPQSDPYRHLQQSLDVLNLSPLRDRLDGSGVSVAVIDSRVQADHPELRGALAVHKDLVPGGASGERHGTGVAGIIAAQLGNGQGIHGVAPGVRLHAYRACWETPAGATRCNSLSLSRALDELATRPPHILNLSLSGPRDPLLERLLDVVLRAGTAVVVAHDPSRPADERFPLLRPGVIEVTSTADADGDGADRVVAPGVAVLTAQPGNSYDFMSGSSIAAAHVSGVLALMLQANPDVAAVHGGEVLRVSMRPTASGLSVDACEAVRSVSAGTACAVRSVQPPPATAGYRGAVAAEVAGRVMIDQAR